MQDKKINDLMNKLSEQTNAWCEYVKSIGNQCAYTDRMLEEVVATAKAIEKAIEKAYEEQFNNDKKVEVFEKLLADEDELIYYLEEHFKMEDDLNDFRVIENGVIVQNIGSYDSGTFYTFRNFVYCFCKEEDLKEYFADLEEEED